MRQDDQFTPYQERSLRTNPGEFQLTGDFFDPIKDINEIDGLGRTALHWASIMGHRNGSPLNRFE